MSRWLKNVTDPEERARIIAERHQRKLEKERAFHARHRERRNAQARERERKQRALRKAQKEAARAAQPKPKKQTNGWHEHTQAWRDRLNKAPEPPRFPGADSIDAFLAMGGAITKCPPRFCAPVNDATIRGLKARGA